MTLTESPSVVINDTQGPWIDSSFVLIDSFVPILLNVNISSNQALLIFLLSVRQTWMTQLILAISLWWVIFLNAKRFYYSYGWSCSLCERKGFLFHRIYLENSADSYLCFWLALLHSLSYFFFLYQSPSLPLCTVFDSILSNIDEVLSNIVSIKPSANVFVFGDFNVHHKD